MKGHPMTDTSKRPECAECGGEAVSYLTAPIIDGPDVVLCRPCFHAVLAHTLLVEAPIFTAAREAIEDQT